MESVARALVSRWALPFLLGVAVAGWGGMASAQPTPPAAGQAPPPTKGDAARTWGGMQGTHEVGAPRPEAQASTPPPAPPATLGVPIDGAPLSPSDGGPAPRDTGAPAAPDAHPPTELKEPLVRAPGRIGLRYTLEGIEVRGNTTTLSRVVLRYVPFRVGDPLDVDDPELALTRFRLLGTGFFRDVELSLRRGSTRGNAILVVTVRERNTIVVNDLWLGLSTDANGNGTTRPLTAYGGIDVSETNLGGTGVTLGGAIAVAEDQLGLRTRFSDPQFLKTQWTLQAELLYNSARDFFGNGSVKIQNSSTDYAVLPYSRLGGSFGAGHDLGISTRLNIDYRLEHIYATPPLAAADTSGSATVPIDFLILPGESYLSTLRATLVYDTLDEPFLPTRGDRVTLLGEVSLSPLGSDYPYAKVQAHAAHWFSLPWGGTGGAPHVLELDAFVGGIFGSAPLFEQYYVGDFSDLLPDRVLGLNFDRRSAPNFFSTEIGEIRYGTYAAKLDAAYRMPVYRGHRAVYGIDLFASVGVYSVCSEQDFSSPPAGITGFATVPIDLTFNLGVQIETVAGGFTFGLSNFLGFIPNYGGGR